MQGNESKRPLQSRIVGRNSVALQQQHIPDHRQCLCGLLEFVANKWLQAVVFAFTAVTEEELSQAMVDGEEITAPPARRSMENGCSASTESSAAESTMETESELLSFGLEETK